MSRFVPLVLFVSAACGTSTSAPTSTAEQLGAQLFHDPALSTPPGQACADCHDPTFAFADPEGDRTSVGVIKGRVGPRNAPSVLYASLIPPLHVDPMLGPVGGQQWDGRASTLAEQAALPLLNPLEMNNPDKAAVVDAVRRAPYASAFVRVFGHDALADTDAAFARITEALAAFQQGPAFSPFASRYDRYLAGRAMLSAEEARGLELFEDPKRGGCASCHPSRPDDRGSPPLFTTHGYANLGLPRFENSNFYRLPIDLNPQGLAHVDHGLSTTLDDAQHDGKFRIPSLRNVARTPPYGHNGYFMSLVEMVDFHATRDRGSRHAIGTCKRSDASQPCPWPSPEVPATLDRRVGDLPLSDRDVVDLVAFLRTLTDEP